MFALPISMQRFKSINKFNQNIPKIVIFAKNAKFFAPVSPAARGFALKSSPHCEILAMRWVFLLLV